MALLGAGFLRVVLTEQKSIASIESEQLARNQLVTHFLADLSRNQRTLSEMLSTAGGQVDEEQIYERGRQALDDVRSLAARFAEARPRFEESAEMAAVYENAVREMTAYRGAVVSALQLATADARLTSVQLGKAMRSYVQLVDQMTSVLDLTGNKIAEKLGDLSSQSRRTSYGLGVLTTTSRPRCRTRSGGTRSAPWRERCRSSRKRRCRFASFGTNRARWTSA